MEKTEKKVPVYVFNSITNAKDEESYSDFLDFNNIKNLKKGDVFYECHFKSGKNYELTVKKDPKITVDGVECVVETILGEEFKIYVSGNTEYRGLNLFKAPQNLTKTADNKFIYIIS